MNSLAAVPVELVWSGGIFFRVPLDTGRFTAPNLEARPCTRPLGEEECDTDLTGDMVVAIFGVTIDSVKIFAGGGTVRFNALTFSFSTVSILRSREGIRIGTGGGTVCVSALRVTRSRSACNLSFAHSDSSSLFLMMVADNWEVCFDSCVSASARPRSSSSSCDLSLSSSVPDRVRSSEDRRTGDAMSFEESRGELLGNGRSSRDDGSCGLLDREETLADALNGGIGTAGFRFSGI